MADPYVLPDPVPVYAGDSWMPKPWRRSYKVGDGPVQYYDYSGWAEWLAHWRPEEDSTADPIVLTVHTDEAADGVIKVTATPEQTRLMASDGVFDVQVSNGPDQVVTLLRGKTKYSGDVTRV